MPPFSAPKAGMKNKGPLKGQLQEKPLETLLFHILKNNLDSELVLQKENSTKKLFFRHGQLIYLTSSLASENFLTFLTFKALLDKEKVQKIKEKEGAQMMGGVSLFLPGNGPRIPNLSLELKNFLKEQGTHCFQDHEGQFCLGPLPKGLDSFNFEGLDPIQIIFLGIKKFYEMDFLAKKFEKIQERRLIRTAEFDQYFPKLEFLPAEIELLKKIDGQMTITQLAVQEGLDLLGTLRLIWALFSIRMVGMVQTEESRAKAKAMEEAKLKEAEPTQVTPPKKVEEKIDPKVLRKEVEKKFKNFEKENFFVVLGVAQKQNATVIRKAYFDLAKKFHPDVLASLGMHDLVEKAGAIFAKMTQAHETLSHPQKRKEYEASLEIDPNVMSKINNIVQAEMEFQKGEIMLRNRAYKTALEQFQKAIDLNSEEAEHFVYLGWAQYLTARGDKKLAASEARRIIQKGLSMRGNIDMAYLFLGRIAKTTGDLKDAEKQFNKALEINPHNDQANSELRFLYKKK